MTLKIGDIIFPGSQAAGDITAIYFNFLSARIFMISN